MFGIFPQQATRLAQNPLVLIKRMELFFLQGLGGSLLMDILVYWSDATSCKLNKKKNCENSYDTR
jgi:hypothetical protein